MPKVYVAPMDPELPMDPIVANEYSGAVELEPEALIDSVHAMEPVAPMKPLDI